MSARHLIEYAALRAVLGVFGLMPADMASDAGGALFRAIGPHMGISKTGRRNIVRAFPDYTPQQVEQVLRAMWDNLGRVVAEYPHLEEIATSERVTFRNKERIDSIRERGLGAVMPSGHLANWEVLPPAFLLRCGLPLHSVYRAPNNPLVDRLVRTYRGFGGRLQSFGKNRRGLAETMKALQNRLTVGMLIDQKMNTGIEAPFFGHPAMTSTAFVELARKIGCPMVPGHIIRKDGCRFEVVIEEEIEVGDRSTEDVVAQMHGILERWIREAPGQWLWIHRRWKAA